MARFHRQHYAKWRTRLLIFLRMHRIFTLYLTIPSPWGPAPGIQAFFPPTSPMSVILPLAIRCVLIAVPTFGYQLVSCAQVLMALIAVFLPAKEIFVTCSSFTVPGLLNQTFLQTHALLANVANAFFQRLVPSVLIIDASHPYSCVAVRLWTLGTFGLALPLIITSIFEDYSRENFLKDKGHLYVPQLSPMHPWTLLHAVTWLLLQSMTLWVLIDAVTLLFTAL